jgi:hypothetical protein
MALIHVSPSLNIGSVNHEGKQDLIKEQEKDDQHPTGKSRRDQEKNQVSWLKEVNLEQLCKEVCVLVMIYKTCFRSNEPDS